MHLISLAADSATKAAAATNSTSNTAPGSPSDGMSGMFMQLLTTQLMNQDPLNPMDPSQFTDQLVQFNMLDQLTQINATLQGALQSDSSSGTGSGSGSGSTSHTLNPLIGGI